MNRKNNENEVERAGRRVFRDFEFMGIKDEYFDANKYQVVMEKNYVVTVLKKFGELDHAKIYMKDLLRKYEPHLLDLYNKFGRNYESVLMTFWRQDETNYRIEEISHGSKNTPPI
jgi:hypothetical protein